MGSLSTGRLFGIETEYGIQVDGVSDMDVVVESMELIRCYLHEDFIAKWDYGKENPRLDMRGFEVDELRNDKDETLHLQKDRERKIPLRELKSDLLISNGARLYNDHTHPEYSTPECRGLLDLIEQDRAGERILLNCAKRRTATRGEGVVRLYKNNTDFEGHSYGCHENYLVSRNLPFQTIIESLLPFLVTRQIFAGAGKVGVEQNRRASPGTYQISQRADFFETIASIDTMHRRPLVNTRDEPHADPQKYRRLHLIVGDANMSEYATALKVGVALLFLDLLDAGKTPSFKLKDPVGALKSVSRDPSREWAIPLADNHWSSAIEIQQQYLQAASELAAGRDDETDWVLDEWGIVLEALPHNYEALIGKCDWVTKKWLLDAFVANQGLDWQDPDHLSWLQSQDLEYHNIDPDEGLFLLLEAQGDCTRLVKEEGISRAVVQPPTGTRAYFRGKLLEKFGAEVSSLNWDSIEVEYDGRVETIDLKSCVDDNTISYYNEVLDGADSIEELVRQLRNPRY